MIVANCVKHFRRDGWLEPDFRNKERIIFFCIEVIPVLKIGIVEIGGEKIDRGCSCFPYVDNMGQWSTTWIIAGFYIGPVECRIDKHRQGIDILSFPCHRVGKVSEMPGNKYFV